MIDRVTLHNYKSHADTTVELGRFTVLVGPNGGGKTSILTALHGLCEVKNPRSPYPFSGHRNAEFLIRHDQSQLHIDCETADTRLEFVFNGGPEAGVSRYVEGDGPLPSAAIIQFDARELAKPVSLSGAPEIRYDGFGVVAVIADLMLGGAEGSARLEAIKQSLKQIVPQARGLQVLRHEGRFELLVDFEHAKGIPAHAVSEGTLILIGLLTLLHSVQRPKLILIDDLDRALHPKAQWELVAILRRLLEQDPELQIVATTHSPYLVDELDPKEVWVTALDQHGVSHCRCLASHPKADRLLDVLSTGELLSAEGEDWVLSTDA